MPSIKKLPDNTFRVVGGTFSYLELIDFIITLFHCLNGNATAYREAEPPKPYNNLGPQGKTIPSPHAGKSDAK